MVRLGRTLAEPPLGASPVIGTGSVSRLQMERSARSWWPALIGVSARKRGLWSPGAARARVMVPVSAARGWHAGQRSGAWWAGRAGGPGWVVRGRDADGGTG